VRRLGIVLFDRRDSGPKANSLPVQCPFVAKATIDPDQRLLESIVPNGLLGRAVVCRVTGCPTPFRETLKSADHGKQ
jgi:hypothetical protein